MGTRVEGGRSGEDMCQSVLPQAADRWKLKRSGEGGRGGGSRSTAALDGAQSQLTLPLKIREAEVGESEGSTPPSLHTPCPKPLPGMGQSAG